MFTGCHYIITEKSQNGIPNSMNKCIFAIFKEFLGISCFVKHLHLLLWFIIYEILFSWSSITCIERPCKTPDDWNGNCIVLQQCRPIYNILTVHLSTEQRNFLRKSQCGHDGTNPLVCCPITFTIDDLPTDNCGRSINCVPRISGGEITFINECKCISGTRKNAHFLDTNLAYSFVDN